MKGKVKKIHVYKKDLKVFKRLDSFLCHHFPEYSRTFLKQLFEKDLIVCEQEKLELKRMPRGETTISLFFPPPESSSIKAQDIALEILHEDDDLLLINKPAGMTVHPAPKNPTDTLANALLNYFPPIGRVGHKTRPGIVHRLDRGTSGVMVAAKSERCYTRLRSLFSSHHIEREYECIVRGRILRLYGTLDVPIGRHPFRGEKMAINGKRARASVTHYEVRESFGPFHHLKVSLETGRTHQIRVHLSSVLCTPVVNDHTYGNPPQDKIKLGKNIARTLGDYAYPLLHAKKLSFIHPITKTPLLFEVEAPEIFQHLLSGLRDQYA